MCGLETKQIDCIELSEPWTGKVSFFLLDPQPERGYMWSCGRNTGIQSNSSRPDYMWVEDWQSLGRTEQQEVARHWKQVLKPRVSLARQNRNIKSYVHPDDNDDYKAKVRRAQDMYRIP